MLQIKANEQLFDRWHFLGSRATHLAGIVQNDFPMHAQGLKVWEDNARDAIVSLSELIEDTLEYLNESKD